MELNDAWLLELPKGRGREEHRAGAVFGCAQGRSHPALGNPVQPMWAQLREAEQQLFYPVFQGELGGPVWRHGF